MNEKRELAKTREAKRIFSLVKLSRKIFCNESCKWWNAISRGDCGSNCIWNKDLNNDFELSGKKGNRNRTETEKESGNIIIQNDLPRHHTDITSKVKKRIDLTGWKIGELK